MLSYPLLDCLKADIIIAIETTIRCKQAIETQAKSFKPAQKAVQKQFNMQVQ